MPEATPTPLRRPLPMDRRQLDIPPPAITAPLEAAYPVRDDTVYATPAGLVRRCAATLIDLLISAAIAVGLVFAFQRGGLKLAIPWYPLIILWGVLIAAQVGISAKLLAGRSIGRRITGLYIVDKEGRVPSATRLLNRSLLSLLSVALFGAGLWLVIFDRRGRSLHDLLTGTFLIQKSLG